MKLRVLLYARVHPEDRGGVQTVFNRLAAHLRACGHTVTKVWGWPSVQPPPGDHVLPLPSVIWRRGLPAPRSTLQAGAALLRCCHRLARQRPDVVNVHFVTAESTYFQLLRPLFRYKLVLSAHGSDVLRPEAPDAPTLPRLLAGADALTAVSAVAADHVAAAAAVHASRITVIPNGVDLAYWSDAAGGVVLADRPPVVLTVGRLDPVKGQDVLLQAFARVVQRFPEARLVVVGGGGLLAHLQELARADGLKDRVLFTGALEPAAIRAHMRAARLFVLPSRSEGLPLAPIEAMAAGLPVVATAVGGVGEIIAPGTGVLVPPENAEALADAVTDLLLDPGRAAAVAARGRERAGLFSARTADAAYERVLLDVAGRAAGDA